MNDQNQPVNNQPVYQPANNQSNGKGFSIAALVLGILSIITAWVYLVNVASLIMSIVGLVMAVLGRKKAKAVGAPSGIGTAGLVLSIIGVVFAGIFFLTCTVCPLCVLCNTANATTSTANGLCAAANSAATAEGLSAANGLCSSNYGF